MSEDVVESDDRDITERLWEASTGDVPFSEVCELAEEAGYYIESLRASRNAVVEECAKVADGYESFPVGRSPSRTAAAISCAIRSLKSPSPPEDGNGERKAT